MAKNYCKNTQGKITHTYKSKKKNFFKLNKIFCIEKHNYYSHRRQTWGGRVGRPTLKFSTLYQSVNITTNKLDLFHRNVCLTIPASPVF